MKYLSMEIRNFIPLLHCGTKSIQIDMVSNTVIVIGTNGCGKSSLFKELTPYPANRSDYEKDGYRKLVVEHNNSTFVITSDFSKSSKAHSFLVDGEEKNESGATGIQVDLCNKYFDLTAVTDDLINLKYHLCDMGKADRKTLFMITYPRSMGFILDLHRNVAYQLRDFSINIRTYKERKISLEEKLMSSEELERIRKLFQKYQALNNDIDQQVYSLRQKISLLQNLEDYKDPANNKDFLPNIGYLGDLEWIEEIDRTVNHALKTLGILQRRNPAFMFQSHESRAILHNSYVMGIDTSSKIKESRLEEVKELKDQLEQFEQVQGIDVEKEIKVLTEKQKNLKELLEKASSFIAGKVFPKMSCAEELQMFNEKVIGKIRFLLGEIFQATSIWSPAKLNQSAQSLWSIKIEKDGIEKQLAQYRNQLQQLQRQNSVVEKIDPNCHSQICHLKEMVSKKLKETEDEIQRITAEGKTLKAKYDYLTALHEAEEKERSEPASVERFVIELIDTLHQTSMDAYLCGGEWNEDHLIELLNTNPSYLWDRLASFVKDNEYYIQCIQYTHDLQITSQELDTMVKIHAPSKDFIVKTVSEKQLRYKKLLDEIDHITEDIKFLTSRKNVTEHILECELDLDDCTKKLVAFKKWYEIHLQIDRMTEQIKFFENGKNSIQSSIVDLETSIKEQDALRTRLNDEVLPNLKMNELNYQKWSAIERGLSPNTGLPHEHMIAYLNSLIKIVNRIIKCVWVYDMEVIPLQNKGELDYGFSFRINNGSPIKDINLASTGQKEILDLAWVLAIYHQMKLGRKYPLKLDEPDGGLNNEHRIRLLNFLVNMMQKGDLTQLFMINQFSSVYDCFGDSQTLCIKEEGIILPSVYNQNVIIEKC